MSKHHCSAQRLAAIQMATPIPNPNETSSQNPTLPNLKFLNIRARICATIPRKMKVTEIVRVSLSHFKGYDLVDIRVWVEGYGGVTRPTKQGISIRREQLPELQQAIDAANSISGFDAGTVQGGE